MSEDEGNDINFNELVGNLLSSHNADKEDIGNNKSSIDGNEDIPASNDEHPTKLPINEEVGTNYEALPTFNEENDDDALAAVVASAIQDMDQEEVPTEDVFDEARAPTSSNDQTEEQQQEEWARILQQGLLQSSEADAPAAVLPGEANENVGDQLDQDDENLRRAILESLQELNVGDAKAGSDKVEAAQKKSSKKSSKKKKKDKLKSKDSEKEKASSKKKKHTKDRKKKKDEGASQVLVSPEDVIRGFMRHEAGSSEAEIGHEKGTEVEDAETHALVEATLKAFERELLGPGTENTSSSQRKPSASKKSTKAPVSTPRKRKSSSKKKTDVVRMPTSSYESMAPPSDDGATSKKEKKKKKKHTKSAEASTSTYEEDEFSRALADMVNQVVNTSLADSSSHAPEEPSKQQERAAISSTVEQQSKKKAVSNDSNDEAFDLNQIMQKAMAMAFQEQHQEGLDTSVMEDFNRGLGDFGVSDILIPTSMPNVEKSNEKALQKSKSGKHKANKNVSRNIPGLKASKSDEISKSTKFKLSSDEFWRKKYSQAAKAAAFAARKLTTEKNKAIKAQQKTERRLAREEKRQRKKQEEERSALERKELEEIVAKGPPYPLDLRLTKSGKPKKPYRRWTKDEMAKRASMPAEDTSKAKKVKKIRKKKSKKLKRIPLSTLKKIPLFNFVKGNIPVNVRQNLNGIDDTLKKIPLTSYKLDINRLAPPEKVTKEEMEKHKLSQDEDDRIGRTKKVALLESFDASRKTVIRREKIPFHPPWVIPSQPPFALPVARRRRKDRGKKDREASRNSSNARRSRDSSVYFNARNKIIPAVLFPIINTLKAAARAKAAAGASSEEASRHLMTIIKHTKKSIAQTLAASRKYVREDYSTIKTEADIHRSQLKESKVKRLPLFSLANIKRIEAKERSAMLNPSDDSVKSPTIIKIEDEDEDNGAADGSTSQEIVEQITENNENELDNSNSGEMITASSKNIPPSTKNSEELISARSITEAPHFNKEGNVKSREMYSSSTATEVMRYEKSSYSLPPQVSSEEPNKNSSAEIETCQATSALDVPIKREMEETLPNPAKKEEFSNGEKVYNVMETLMKQQFSQGQKSLVDLPSNFQSILTATLGELLPTLEGDDAREAPAEEVKSKRSRRAPAQVLNLDGLVPPVTRQFVPKIEERKLPIALSSGSSKVGINKRGPEQKIPSYTFDIPDTKDLQGKRIMLLKRAKRHLSNAEMNVLKKEMNKERKRKWREANVEKNWENDLRARVKRRANAKFGDVDTSERDKWISDELTKSLADRGTKSQDNNTDKKNGASTNLKDSEVLNMIATTLNKLDVARLLEKELNEEASKRFQEEVRKPASGKVVLNESSNEALPQHADAMGSSHKNTTLNVPGKDSNQEEQEEFDEDGILKRPYPDDIPIAAPVLKRPKFDEARSVT